MFIFIPFAVTTSPALISAGHGPSHFESVIVVRSDLPNNGGSK
jgi:hypothetical protein